MSNSEPNAIVLQGIPRMCGLYQFRTTLAFCGGDFQVLLEIFKVILCSDFLLSSVIHHFPK